MPFPGTPGLAARALPSARVLLVAVASVAAIVGAYALARMSPLFALDRVEVTGAPAPLEQSIQSALAPLHGESLLAFRSRQAQERLAAIPEIASVSYDRAFPHTLRLTVVAEHPVAVLRQGSRAWLAAASGRVLHVQSKDAHPRYPRIWLPASTRVEAGGSIPDAAAARGLRLLWTVHRIDFQAPIRFVRSSSRELTLVLRTGTELRLGELDRIPLKLAVARRLLPSVEVPASGAPYLDLTVPERPVASASESQVAG